jgi:hypothetical protein
MLQSRLPVDTLDWILWGLQAVVLILAISSVGINDSAGCRG